MENWKKDLHKNVKQGTSLLEIVFESIERQTSHFAVSLDQKPSLIKKEITKIVIQSLNDDLDSLCKEKK